MILKRVDTNKTNHSTLDLLGNNEVALSKAFAHLLASDKDCYFYFLRFLGIKIKNTFDNYQCTTIEIEKCRTEGRTDIELTQNGKYHVIIECKIRKGKIYNQRTQYLTAFNKNVSQKIICFLTQERDTNKQIENGTTIKNTSWLEIIELFNNKHFINKPIVNDFLKFAIKNYKMKELKEILIQDLKNRTEIIRYKEHRIYRREQVFGTPIYFAPYFNRGSGETEGITNLSKILGILTFKPEDIENFRSDIESFSIDNTIINRWINGITLGNDTPNKTYTYYFLDEPFIFKTPLRKDGGKEKGRGKDWIAAMIPQNRCVSFVDFIRHIPELMTNN